MSKRLLFYSSWLLLHIIQAATTELFDDEAYYWVYSVFPAWGYFDHPPMIALLIKSGYAIFHNELGVRLLTIFLSTASIFLIEDLLEEKNATLFDAICGSLALAQIGGMMAAPDTSLMFFVALFFWLYRRFIIKMDIANAILIGVCIALMLYSKYHGVLIVLFTWLSNPKLFQRWQPYAALLTALTLFVPHIYWQYLHNYPSVQFHLFERNSGEYEIKHTIEYILGQIVLAGPIMGWLLIIAALLYKPVTLTERALKFSFVGIYIFFFISTFKGRAEANWTIPSFIGMMVLAHQYLLTHDKWRKWLYYSLPVTLSLVLAARILMMVDMPPKWWLAKDEFHQNKLWVNAIKQKAGTVPVIFPDTYQRPSKYWFYSGDTAMALNTPYYRRNNYNFWAIEDSLIGKQVYVANNKMVDNYYSFSRVMIDNIKLNEIASKELSIRFRTITPENYLLYFQDPAYRDALIYITVYKKKKVVANYSTMLSVKDITKTYQENIVSVKLDNLKRGSYTAKFSIGTCLPRQLSLNSSEFSIRLK
jgi:hypothetical protein